MIPALRQQLFLLPQGSACDPMAVWKIVRERPSEAHPHDVGGVEPRLLTVVVR